MTVYNLDVLLSQLNLSVVPCPVLSGCFLTCIQDSQEAGKVVWYSFLVKNSPQLVVPQSKAVV